MLGEASLGKLKRGGYIFISWKGDHAPKHIHVYKDGKEVLKWNLDEGSPIKGVPTRKIINFIEASIKEGKL